MKHRVGQEEIVRTPTGVIFKDAIFSRFHIYLAGARIQEHHYDFKMPEKVISIWDMLRSCLAIFKGYFKTDRSDERRKFVEQKFINKWLEDKKNWILNFVALSIFIALVVMIANLAGYNNEEGLGSVRRVIMFFVLLFYI